jgi:hypothetical protein
MQSSWRTRQLGNGLDVEILVVDQELGIDEAEIATTFLSCSHLGRRGTGVIVGGHVADHQRAAEPH